MDRRPGAAGTPVDLDEAVAVLRRAGAAFGYLHGSVVAGCEHPDSDVDVAAWFGREVDPIAVGAGLPGRIDLLVLDSAPLELAGRVALHGRLLFDDDPPARVAWEATTRKIYLDERPRSDRARADFARAQTPGPDSWLSVVDPERLHRILRRITDDLAVLHGYASVDRGELLADPARLATSSICS